MSVIKYKTGIDALDYLNEIISKTPREILDQIDTIVWDPPYLASGFGEWKNKDGGEVTKIDLDAFVINDDIKSLKTILETRFPNAKWIKFNTNINEINTKEKVMIWYKPDVPESNLIGNVEFIELSNVAGKEPRIPFKSKIYAIPREKNTRVMSKPSLLYEKLFRLLNSKSVLDLFAGYGNSIKVCKAMGISIYACDIDTRLEPIWQGHLQQQSLKEWDINN